MIERNYLFELNMDLQVDAHHRGDLGRYVNDPGLDGEPNCVPRSEGLSGIHLLLRY